MEDDYQPQSPQAYDPLIRTIMQKLAESAGSDDAYRTRALESQLQSAKDARANAMKIAQLQASTSRYGADLQARTEMARLKENARQYDATHGLDIAEAYTKYSQTPDMMWARNDFLSAMGRVGQGGGLPAPIASAPNDPTPKGWQDFAALASYNGSSVPGGGGGGGTSSPTDPRVSAASAVMKAIPPSGEAGTTDQDWAALNAIRSLYFSAQPGSLERLGPERRKIAQAGMARLGYDPNLIESEYKRSLPGQQSVRLA